AGARPLAAGPITAGPAGPARGGCAYRAHARRGVLRTRAGQRGSGRARSSARRVGAVAPHLAGPAPHVVGERPHPALAAVVAALAVYESERRSGARAGGAGRGAHVEPRVVEQRAATPNRGGLGGGPHG